MEAKHHKEVKELLSQNKTTKEIAVHIGVSYGRAYQIIGKIKRIQERELKYPTNQGDLTMQYIAEFSTNVEYIRRLDKSKILHIVQHPVIMGDIFIRIIIEKEDIHKIPFNMYHDDWVLCEEKHGGLKVWKVRDIDVYRGKNEFNEICEFYGFHDLVDY